MTTHMHSGATLEDLVLTFRRKIIDVCRKEGLPYDLTLSQAEIVRYVGKAGKGTMKDIASHLKITPPSATAMIDELEKKDVVLRKADLADRRIVSITLTAKAHKIYSAMQKHKETVLNEMLSRLSPTEKKSLERIITILIKD